MNSVLQVQNLGKSYRQWGSEKRRIASWFLPSIKPHTEHWVLKDVNFSVNPGEAIGIIGRNGAGKSTLLKIITGTTYPTLGKVQLSGRVAAILELGMGFNQDLTGRQNAYHSAGLMGYSQSDITRVMPAIEAFAEIGDYFDQPVRTYSSGMQMRVAFSVATAFRPDILIVDEALSVGDVYFQQKCFRRIQEYCANGTTLLFVTHDLVGVTEFCSRAIYLRNGQVIVDDSPHAAIAVYQADIMGHANHPAAKSNVTQSIDTVDQTNRVGDLITTDVTCLSVGIQDEYGNKLSAILSGHSAILAIRYRVHRHLLDPHVGFKIHNRLGSVIFETNTFCMKKTIGAVEEGAEIETHFHFPIDLAPSEYTITFGMVNLGFDKCEFKERLHYAHSFFAFTVLPNDEDIIWSGITNIHPNVAWTIYQGTEQFA
jgi:lipopolysaccharide transport system ATP-binding protein